jgi:D-sedoheptulose 7-phosphate isomerase
MADFSDRTTNFSACFLAEVEEIARRLDTAAIENTASLLAEVRDRGGRLFILGVGGSAGNASHALNDFRKLVGLETYAPTDNISELTARVNDEGWSTVFDAWLRVSRLQSARRHPCVVCGRGRAERNVSPNIVAALDYAKSVGASILGIVGRDGGYTARVADVCVIVPTVHPERVTPLSEAFQAIVWHLLVSHPVLQQKATGWESLVTIK